MRKDMVPGWHSILSLCKKFGRGSSVIHELKQQMDLCLGACMDVWSQDKMEEKVTSSGADPGEVKWVNFQPPFF